MARRPKPKQTVSLFPFLDILACVIGNLILIITTVVLEQMDTKPLADAARVENMRQEIARQAQRQAELEQRLQDLRKQSGDVDRRLEEAQQRVDAARREFEQAQRQLQTVEKQPDAKLPPDTTAAVAKLKQQRRELNEEIAKIQAEIAERKKVPERSIVLLPPASGGGGPLRGTFVEVTNGQLIVHQGKQPWKVPAGQAATNPKFQQLLEQTKNDEQAIITFLVRPDGMPALRHAERAAAAIGARTGRVPLPGDGQLDFSQTP